MQALERDGSDTDADLAGLLASGERAAFHGKPAAAISDLERAVVTAQREGKRAEVTAAAWLLGVALAASGRYGGGLRVLVPLLEAGESAEASLETKLFSALAAATAASVHRGLGRHEAARDLDHRGFELTDGTGEAGFDCQLGLACDAVGLGDVAEARARMTQAESIASAHGNEWWRQRVRLGWAHAEIALLCDDPEAAAALAAASVVLAERSRAARHVAKGLLFQAVAELTSGNSDAVTTLHRSATLAEQLGTLPLVWNSRALLGVVVADTDPEGSARSLGAARSAVLAIAGDLTPQLRDEWLTRPNVAALLEG